MFKVFLGRQSGNHNYYVTNLFSNGKDYDISFRLLSDEESMGFIVDPTEAFAGGWIIAEYTKIETEEGNGVSPLVDPNNGNPHLIQ